LHELGGKIYEQTRTKATEIHSHLLLIIDISKHGAKEMGHVKMAGPGFVKDVTA
jgi:hypothetical protein